MQNCVESVLRHAPSLRLTVFDDNSTDKRTVSYLKHIGSSPRLRIVSSCQESSSTPAGGGGLGNLYANINHYIYHLASSRYCLLMQDDMQFVRDLLERDLALIYSTFESSKRSAFMFPCFLRSELDFSLIDSDSDSASSMTYLFREDYEFSGYWDVCIANIHRVIEAGWYLSSELDGSNRALYLFGRMTCMKVPLVASLPCPPTYRQGSMTIALLLWNYFFRGFFPFESLSGEQVNRYFELGNTLAADTSLFSPSLPKNRTWTYTSFEGDVKWLSYVHIVELKARKILFLLMALVHRYFAG